MSSNKSAMGVPVVSLEDPEVVKLRIAKEHLDTLFELKRAQLNSTSGRLSRLLATVEELEASFKPDRESVSYEVTNMEAAIDVAWRRLFTYGENLKVLDTGLRTTYIASSPLKKDFERIKGEILPGARDFRINGRDVRWSHIARSLAGDRQELLSRIQYEIDNWKKQQLAELQIEIAKILT